MFIRKKEYEKVLNKLEYYRQSALEQVLENKTLRTEYYPLFNHFLDLHSDKEKLQCDLNKKELILKDYERIISQQKHIIREMSEDRYGHKSTEKPQDRDTRGRFVKKK